MGIPDWPVSGARERELLDEVLSSDRWGGYHPMVARFEREFAAFQHCRYGLAAMNGTVTLEMALEATRPRDARVRRYRARYVQYRSGTRA